MHPRRRWLAFSSLTACVLLALLAPAHAKMSAWKDVQGASFRGEPREILGPLAVFSTGGHGGRWVLLRALSPEDCLRFQAEIAALPPRANRFSDAKGYATANLVGKVQRVQG
ncbi:MAG TPA: hypothetical protein VIM71_03650 [Lacunisphaera sp.]